MYAVSSSVALDTIQIEVDPTSSDTYMTLVSLFAKYISIII